jgi:hypothetical protein
MKQVENELAAVVHANPSVCPAIHGVAYCLTDEPLWQCIEPNERKERLLPLAKLVIGTRVDGKTAIGRAWLAADQGCLVFTPLVLNRLATALECFRFAEFSGMLRERAAALEGLFAGSRPANARIRAVVHEAAEAVDSSHDLISVIDSMSLARVVVDAREAAWAVMEAVRTASRLDGEADDDRDESRALSVGVDVGTAVLAAVRVAYGVSVIVAHSLIGIKPGDAILKVVGSVPSPRIDRDMVRDKMIDLVSAMCATKGRSYLPEASANGVAH